LQRPTIPQFIAPSHSVFSLAGVRPCSIAQTRSRENQRRQRFIDYEKNKIIIPGEQQLLFELYLLSFISLSLLTADINYKFKRFGFCNLLMIIIRVIWNSTFKLNAFSLALT
jgi:hypothetical protein